MKIIVDSEGRQAIMGLLDAALRVGGIANLNPANVVLSSMKGGESPQEKIPAKEPGQLSPSKKDSGKKQ